MDATRMNLFEHLCSLVGATPMARIAYTYKGEPHHVHVKLEHYNLTGSVKDRMALFILFSASRKGLIGENCAIAEATSGNTGIAFASIGRLLGHPVKIFMPDWLSSERINLIKSFGADIELVSAAEGGFKGCIRKAEEYAKTAASCFLPSQFTNEFNCKAHYHTTGPEIRHQLRHLDCTADAFVAGVGTGGTIMGVGRYLRKHNENVKLFPLEPANSPTLSTGHKVGRHRIEGISDEFIPDIVKLDELDDILAVDDGDAILMAKKIASTIGFGVGISSGANFLGAVKAQQMLGKERVIVTLFPDDNKKYLSTDLMRDIPEKEGYLSPDIENLRIETVVKMRDIDIDKEEYTFCDKTQE